MLNMNGTAAALAFAVVFGSGAASGYFCRHPDTEIRYVFSAPQAYNGDKPCVISKDGMHDCLFGPPREICSKPEQINCWEDGMAKLERKK